MTFRPQIGIDGLRVVSSLDIETFTCAKLDSQVVQLGIILYPLDLINEKFLLSVRNCMLKLGDKHPVKKWLKAQAKPLKPDPKEQERLEFLTEILSTQFNLLTDQKTKARVISLLAELPDKTNLERLLKSYLYLMIGNLSRSDQILREIISRPPRIFYQGFSVENSLYHRLTQLHLEKVLRKFGRHPSDRLTFHLFTVYLKNFTNKRELLAVIEDIEPNRVSGKMGLSFTERIAPELVNHTRLARMSEKRRIKTLRKNHFSLPMQALWIWPFMDVDPLVSEEMVNEVKALDKSDPLWAIYLLEDEKLADLYFKKGGLPILRRRSFLRSHLADPADYMLTLYKLIEIGDIDEDLVLNVSQFLKHE